MNSTNRAGIATWKNPSYTESRLHKMAILMATDNDFAVFRKFTELNFFNLLHVHHRLTELEKNLCEHLEKHLDVGEIVIEIRQSLKEYNAAYLALSALRDAHKPSDKTLSIIGSFSDSHRREFREELGDLQNMTHRRLMSLAATDKTWLHNFVDDHPFLQKLFTDNNTAKEAIGIRYFSGSMVSSFVIKLERLLITLGFCVLLLGPVYWLSVTKILQAKLGIVAGFVVCVALLTAGLTRAQNWEIFTVTAAYCAILVVFLSSGIGPV